MRNLKLSNLGLCLTLMLSVLSCTEDQNIESKVSSKNISQVRSGSFSTSVSVSKESDYLVFSSFDDVDKFLSDASTASQEDLNLWEIQNDFKSQRRVFHNVIVGETNLDSYLNNLSPAAQELEKRKPTYYSAEHDEALSSGFIKYYGVGADSYWDYTLIQPTLAGVVNEKGMIKVGVQLIKYSNNTFIYIVKDGDINKLPLALSKTENYEDADIRVIRTNAYNPEGTVTNVTAAAAGLCYSLPHQNNFSQSNNWQVTNNNKKRVKVFLDGNANANFGSSQCVYGTQCTWTLRTQAQRKNFWGNWGYHSDFGPSCSIVNANWTYVMSLMPTCSDYPTSYSNYITGGSNPKPIWNKFIPWTNNGFFNMHPHTTGWWVFNNHKICTTINMVNYNIPVTYNGFGPTTWNLVK